MAQTMTLDITQFSASGRSDNSGLQSPLAVTSASGRPFALGNGSTQAGSGRSLRAYAAGVLRARSAMSCRSAVIPGMSGIEHHTGRSRITRSRPRSVRHLCKRPRPEQLRARRYWVRPREVDGGALRLAAAEAACSQREPGRSGSDGSDDRAVLETAVAHRPYVARLSTS